MDDFYFDKYYRQSEWETMPAMMYLYWEFVKHSMEYDANISSKELNLSLLPHGREFQADFLKTFPTRMKKRVACEGGHEEEEEEEEEETPETIAVPFTKLFKTYPTVNMMVCSSLNSFVFLLFSFNEHF